MTVKVSLRPAVFALRMHKNGSYGDAYHGSAMVMDRGDTAEIVGLTMTVPFTKEHGAAVNRELAAEGFSFVTYERRAGDKTRLVRQRVQPGR